MDAIGSRDGKEGTDSFVLRVYPCLFHPPLSPAKLTAFIDYWPQITLNSNDGSRSSRGCQTFPSQGQEERSSRYLWHAARSFRHTSKAKDILQSFHPTFETITEAVTKTGEGINSSASFTTRGTLHGLYPCFLRPQWLEVRRNEVRFSKTRGHPSMGGTSKAESQGSTAPRYLCQWHRGSKGCRPYVGPGRKTCDRHGR